MNPAHFDYLTGLVSHIKFDHLSFQTANIYSSKSHERASVLLISKLMLYGGNFVSIPNAGVDDINMMLNNGEMFRGEVGVVDAGDEFFDEEIFNQINEDPSKFKIFRGYALHTDGGWRPHTWVYNEEDDMVIDHVKKRKAYYGVEIQAVGPDENEDEYEDSIINEDDDNTLYGEAWSSQEKYMLGISGGLKRL